MGRDWKKRMGCILLAVILTVSNVQPVFATAVEDNGTGLCDHHMVHENCGYVEGEENSCTYSCALCIAEEKAIADQAAADAVSMQIAALPTVDAVKEMAREAQLSAYEQTQAVYAAYNALTEEQKALLPSAEEVFKPLFDYFNSLTAKAMDVSDSFVTAGSCGDLTWELNERGTLTISGEGAIPDYYVSNIEEIPWYQYRYEIKKVILENGVTSIGSLAFESCENMTEVIIPNTVTSVGLRAFHCCSNLTEVTIPDSVSSIGGWAFRSCKALTKIKIPSGVASIEERTFEYCSSLNDITLPNTVTSIGNYAFEYCNSLPQITIPEYVVNIGASAFMGANSLTEITIPKSVTNIGIHAFAHMSSLKNVIFEGDAPKIDDFVFYNETTTITAYYPKNNKTWTEQAMQEYDENVTWVAYDTGGEEADNATSGTCGDLAWELDENGTLTISGSGEMPSYITEEYNLAPWRNLCDEIKKVVVGNGVTNVGASAFYKCKNLKEVILSPSVVSIDNHAFAECPELSSIEIPDSVANIGNIVFFDCTSLTSLTIPKSIKTLGYAFCACSGLKEIRFLGDAPPCVPSAPLFESVTATAYYPAGNETWTEEVRQSYGGTITWVTYNPDGSQSNYIFYPENGASEVGTVSASGEKVGIDKLTITFDKEIKKNSANDSRAVLDFSAGTIAIYRKDDDTLVWKAEEDPFTPGTAGGVVSVDSAQTTLVIEPVNRNNMLDFDTEYYVVVDAGVISFEDDGTNETIAKGNWEFKTIIHPETLLPAEKPLKIEDGIFSYWSTVNGSAENYTFDYDEEWFLKDSSEYNYNLLKMSMRLALASARKSASSITALYDTLKFHYSETSVNFPEPETDSIGYAIGSKNVIDEEGNKFTLISIGIRGAGYEKEWGGNFRIGTGSGDHEGFSIAARKVLAGLEEHLAEIEDSCCSDIKVWIAGYSRAAATANLLASELNNGKIEGISKENVYAYCFACPQNTQNTSANRVQYNNIVNVVNPIDFVPKVAMSDWGFTRYGVTYYLPSAVVNSNYYSDLKPRMLDAYYDILYFYYSNNDANEKLPTLTGEAAEQTARYDEIVDELATQFSSREKYVNIHQQKIVQNIAGAFDLNPINIFNMLNILGREATLPGFVDHINNVVHAPMINVAHYPELYLAWIDCLDGNVYEFTRYTKYRKVFINCPVNIEVYNSDGNLVGQIKDGIPVEMPEGIGIYQDEQGQNVLVLPCNEEYDIKLTATDSGHVTYTVTERNLDNGQIEKIVSYYELVVAKEDTLIGTIENLNEVSNAQYPLSLNGTTCESDILQVGDSVEKYSVMVQSAGNGTVSGNTVCYNGEFAKVIATPGDGSHFEGWFVNDKLVSTELEYRFLVTSDVSITGRFIDDTTGGDTSDDETPDDEAADIDDILAQLSGMTAQNVVPGDKTKILSILGTIEVLLAEEELTDEQRQLLTTAKEKGEMLLDAIAALETAAKNVSDRITGLPATVEPDDEATVAKIMAVKKAYDELDTRTKAMISTEQKAKLDALVKATTDYKIIKGDNGKWWKNSGKTLSFTVNAPFSKFESIEIDGKTIAESNYIANSGSTIITLKSSYLQTLSTGEHTITVVFTDNEASGNFTIQKATSIPFTGDTFNVTLWISVMVVAGASLVVLLYKKRKQK